AGPKEREAARMERTRDYCGGRRFRSRLKGIDHRVRHRHHENEVGDGKRGCSHPATSEKEKTSRRKTTKERQGQQREVVIIGQRSSREIQPVGAHQNAETASQGPDRKREIANVIFRQLIMPEVKQVSRNERYK